MIMTRRHVSLGALLGLGGTVSAAIGGGGAHAPGGDGGASASGSGGGGGPRRRNAYAAVSFGGRLVGETTPR